MTRVILVRHGESTFNVQRRVQGHCDESNLTEAGRIAARQVGAALSGIPLDAIYSSPLRRAKTTTELIVETLSQDEPTLPDVSFSQDLYEVNLCQWEAVTFKEIKEKFPEDYKVWQEEPHNLRMDVPTPEGDIEFYPIRAVYDQARRFWHDVLPVHQGQTILVVGHSVINRALVQTAMGLGPESLANFRLSNCGISIVNFSGALGDPIQLESFNLVDHIGDPVPEVRGGHLGPRILLVRHGETNWNRDKKFQGQIDVPLNDNGRQQAEQCAEFLKGIHIDRAISSPMLRPKETAEIILKRHLGVVLELDENLVEIGHGLWEGKFESEIEAEFPGELNRWKETPEAVQMPEGENLQQVWERAEAAWKAMLDSTIPPIDGEDLAHPQTILVVAHDAVNKSLLCQLMGLEPENFWAFKQGNGSVSVIDYPTGPEGRPLIQALNITSFIGGVLDKTAAGAL
ncbi:MAG: histidine phosphatase family protein [Cyanobacteria bacterium P01_E01_bin.6]